MALLSIQLITMQGHQNITLLCLKKNLNASRPSEHPPIRGGNVKTFRWDHGLQIQNFMVVVFSTLTDRASTIPSNINTTSATGEYVPYSNTRGQFSNITSRLYV